MKKMVKILVFVITTIIFFSLFDAKTIFAGACPPTVGTCWYGTSNYVNPLGTCGGPGTANCYAAGTSFLQAGTAYYGGSCSSGMGTQYHSYCCNVSSCGGGGGGECPAECRKDACGVGYSNATGCSGCNANQVCCKPNSCPPPANNSPKGTHDSSNCTRSRGWTCDADNYSQSLTVRFYKDGLPGVGTYIGQTTANITRESAVGDQCGGQTAHGFEFTTPTSVKDDVSHEIYAMAVNIGSTGSNSLLIGTPKTINCPAPCNTTAPSAISFDTSTSTLTWTPGTNGISQNLYVSTRQSDVNNNCGTGTNCVVNATLASNANSYPFVSPLLPNTTYFVKLRNYKSVTCSSSTNYSFITPVANEPWWQVQDGDVTTNGSLSSLVPSGRRFLKIGLGGFPGVAVYGTSLNLYLNTPERISNPMWNTNTTTTQSRIFNYSYFENLIPEDIVFNNINDLPSGGAIVDSNGYEWYKVVGNLNTVGNIDLTTRKVVLFVEGGNLNINGSINLTDGIGFFASFVNGDITVDPSVGGSPSIEGIYMADNNVTTGTGTTQFHLRGSIASYGSVLLERELLDNSTPTELFEFAPDQIMLFPSQLQFKRAKWSEVAP